MVEQGNGTFSVLYLYNPPAIFPTHAALGKKSYITG